MVTYEFGPSRVDQRAYANIKNILRKKYGQVHPRDGMLERGKTFWFLEDGLKEG
jgi:hypothetical protein